MACFGRALYKYETKRRSHRTPPCPQCHYDNQVDAVAHNVEHPNGPSNSAVVPQLILNLRPDGYFELVEEEILGERRSKTQRCSPLHNFEEQTNTKSYAIRNEHVKLKNENSKNRKIRVRNGCSNNLEMVGRKNSVVKFSFKDRHYRSSSSSTTSFPSMADDIKKSFCESILASHARSKSSNVKVDVSTNSVCMDTSSSSTCPCKTMQVCACNTDKTAAPAPAPVMADASTSNCANDFEPVRPYPKRNWNTPTENTFDSRNPFKQPPKKLFVQNRSVVKMKAPKRNVISQTGDDNYCSSSSTPMSELLLTPTTNTSTVESPIPTPMPKPSQPAASNRASPASSASSAAAILATDARRDCNTRSLLTVGQVGLHAASPDVLEAKVNMVDMEDAMLSRAIGAAVQGISSCNTRTKIAEYVKIKFDERFGGKWHCIVGSQFGSFVAHDPGCFAYFSVGQYAVLLWKLAD